MKNKRDWKYFWTLFYWVFYLIGFELIEKFITPEKAHIISLGIDHKIPFIPQFIYFYYLWFPFIFFTFWVLFFNDKKEYLRMITFLYVGMTLFIVLSVIYPNGLDIRPTHLEVNNLSTWLVALIYKSDTPTNVLPSIHIYNSIGMAIALSVSSTQKKAIKVCSWLLTFLIIIATFVTKQHGIIDAISAVILSIIMYVIVYKKDIYLLK